MADELYDVTVKVTGHGFELVEIIGGLGFKPDPAYVGNVKRAGEEAFAYWFAREHEASAVTVGPHRAEGDDDHEVG